MSMRYRDNYSFIDPSFKNRLTQHSIFWVFVTIYLLLGSFRSRYETLPESLKYTLLYLPGHMFMVYNLLYFLIPYYVLKRKFLLFFLLLVPIFFISAAYIRFIDTTAFTTRETFRILGYFSMLYSQLLTYPA